MYCRIFVVCEINRQQLETRKKGERRGEGVVKLAAQKNKNGTAELPSCSALLSPPAHFVQRHASVWVSPGSKGLKVVIFVPFPMPSKLYKPR